MGISTGTVCPFPYTAPGSNLSYVPTDISECTQTYGSALGPEYQALRFVAVAIAALGVIVMCYRMWLLTLYVNYQHMTLKKHPMFILILMALFFHVCFLVASVDMFAFNALYPPELFAVLDEFCAASGITNALLTIDLYYQLIRGVHKDQRHRAMAIRVRNGTVIAVWVNFVGFIILGVVDYSNFKLYESLKSICGGLILISFVFLSTYYVMLIRGVMRRGMDLMTDKKKAQERLKTLTNKHLRYAFIVSFGGIVLFANAAINLEASDYNWTLKISELPDPAQVTIRVVFILYVFLTFYLYRPPSLNAVETGTSTDKSGNGPGNNLNGGNGTTGEHRVIPVADVANTVPESKGSEHA